MKEYKMTLQTAGISPETTSLDFLLEHQDYLNELADMLNDSKATHDICMESQCSECIINANKFNPELCQIIGGTDCQAPRTALAVVKNLYDRLTVQNKKQENTCNSCKHCKKGEYLYCEAWHNSTVDNMHCGYYTDIDK